MIFRVLPWSSNKAGVLLNKNHSNINTIILRFNSNEISSSSQSSSAKYLRNIGIVAHINAGKTTTTERILYHAGSTNLVGDVDKGNTVTDYLIQERDRGITITSAAVSFKWNKHQVNLIDTPGHVDFTFEVERSLAVLDGVITLLDSSAGVEAQTITVWNQARKYHLPNVIFLNKYDKIQANYKMCMSDLNRTLDTKSSLIQVPIKSALDNKFSSIVDVIQRRCLSWTKPDEDHGSIFIDEPANLQVSASCLDKKHLELIEELREDLVNKLCDVDDILASQVINCDKICEISGDLIAAALRRATLNCQLSPVLVGSSFKNIGVQQLMNAIIDYLPTPMDREKQLLKLLSLKEEENTSSSSSSSSSSNIRKDTCGFIFKIMHDKRLGSLCYVKLLNGSLERLQKLKNLENSKVEQVKKVYRVFADELKELDKPVYKHDIVVLTGLIESQTGDILVDQSFQNQEFATTTTELPLNDYEEAIGQRLPFRFLTTNSQKKIIILPKINKIEPVYFCSIESKNASQQLKFEQALKNLAREDPSFTYEIDQLGITTIRGMGKLHLEIIRDRIESEYKIEPLLGALQISYRETIQGSATEELQVNRLINSVNNSLMLKLYVRAKPNLGRWTGKMLRLDLSGESSLGKLRHDHRKAIENGFMSALAHGPTMGCPMIDCDILLLQFEANRRCGLPFISSIASQCLMSALSRCSPVLLEPIMLLEVVIPNEFNGIVLSDLSTTRRGIIQSASARNVGDIIVVRSLTPLATLFDYSEYLRISTSGRGSFSMELHSYSAVSDLDKQKIVRL